MFISDKPITSSKEDLLGRNSFAQSLADAILSHKETDSIVVGLYGEWGTGKTSVINLLIENMELIYRTNMDKNKPIIIEFNPWNYSDQYQLISQFFRELSYCLKRIDYSTKIKKAGELIEIYSKYFEPVSLIPQVGIIATILSKLGQSLGGLIRFLASRKATDLYSVKTELHNLLMEQSQKIIIVIDDIDRLNNIEIRQIFQLVKSLCDFPNTIYLIAFDKKVVINALTKVQEGSGLEYLEKVIQVPFDIPAISKENVEALLFKNLDEMIKGIPQKDWDSSYWAEVYNTGLKHFFNNLRDVIRFVNSLKFSYHLIIGEVNVIDMFAITAIQIFVPDIYYGIRNNKHLFTGILDSHPSIFNAEKEQTIKRCEEIISRETRYSKEKLLGLIKVLFPKINSCYGNISYGYQSLGEWRKSGRICSPELFNTFFRLSIPKGDLPKSEIEAILSIANDQEAFIQALLNLTEDGRIVKFLGRVEDYTRDYIPDENIQPIINVLMDIGDFFPEEKESFLVFGTPMRIIRICYQLSNRFGNHDKRFEIFKNAIEKATRSLHTIVLEVSIQGQQHGKGPVRDEPLPEIERTVNENQLNELERIACKKIRTWADDGRLKEHNRLPYILIHWNEWGDSESVKTFVLNMIADNEGLIKFVTSFLYEIKSYGLTDYSVRINWKIHPEEIGKIIDLDLIEPKIRNILSSPLFEQLSEKEKLAISLFIETIDKGRKEGFEKTPKLNS